MKTSASPVTIPIQSIDLSPGSHLLIEGVSWEQYKSILQELGGDRLLPRINYSQGILELMVPLPVRERPHRIIGYIATTILEVYERDWEDFGSTTFKKLKQAGVEPDTCFYIQNAERVRSLERINLETDPPPDLAIEADVTSQTTLEAYEAIKVPEVWLFIKGQLKVYVLEDNRYQESKISSIFPELDVVEMIPRLVREALANGTRKMLRSLRQELSQL